MKNPRQARSPKNKNRTRNSLLGRVHLAKKALRLNDDDYRAAIADGWGKTSAGDLPEKDLKELCNVLERQAQTGEFAPGGKQNRAGRRRSGAAYPGRPANIGATAPTGLHGEEEETSRSRQLRKIEALLAEKSRVQGNPVPWAYADAIARNTCKVEKVAWVPTGDLYKIITALQKDAEKHAEKQGREG